jgi:hypothetical protein
MKERDDFCQHDADTRVLKHLILKRLRELRDIEPARLRCCECRDGGRCPQLRRVAPPLFRAAVSALRLSFASKSRLCLQRPYGDFCASIKKFYDVRKITSTTHLFKIRISNPLTTNNFDKVVINYSVYSD